MWLRWVSHVGADPRVYNTQVRYTKHPIDLCKTHPGVIYLSTMSTVCATLARCYLHRSSTHRVYHTRVWNTRFLDLKRSLSKLTLGFKTVLLCKNVDSKMWPYLTWPWPELGQKSGWMTSQGQMTVSVDICVQNDPENIVARYVGDFYFIVTFCCLTLT